MSRIQKELIKLTNKLKLSKKSQEFLENLRVYLFSSGKNTDEIENIIDELENHLLEAEEDGKPIEKIIGNSPKEYMNDISNEMKIDNREWVKYIFIIVFGSFTFKIYSDLLAGNLSFSILEIVGHIIIGVVFFITVFSAFKYLSTTNHSLKIQALVFGGTAMLPLILFFGLIYLNRIIDTPLIEFGNIGSLIVGVIAALFIIGTSIWAKTWMLIIVFGLLILPDFLLNLTSLQYETQLFLSTMLTFGGIAIYLLIVTKLEKNK